MRDPSQTKVREELSAEGRRIAVVVSDFNREITVDLLDGAVSCIVEHGGRRADLDVFHVPGAWELPQTAQHVVEAARHDAVVALGCVIRGETPHFDFICAEASRGLGAVARSSSTPVTFGVLTTDTTEQARVRAARDGQDKGWEAALAALELIAVFESISSGA